MFDDESAPARTARHLFERALELQQRGALADAIRLYKESLAHLPTAEAHTFLGWAYARLHRFDAAVEECRLAIDLDPDFGNPYHDIGAYYIELERWDEAAGEPLPVPVDVEPPGPPTEIKPPRAAQQ